MDFLISGSKRVCFDNSFLNKNKEQAFIYIKENFPCDEYQRIVQFDVVLEYFYSAMENEDIWHEWRKLGLSMFDENTLLITEYYYGPHWCNFQLKDFSNHFLSMSKQEKETFINHQQERLKDAKDRYLSINASNEDIITISNDLVWVKVQEICDNSQHVNSYIENVLRRAGQNHSPELTLKNDFKVKKITNIRQELPSFYNLLVFNVFWDILKTPFTFSKRKLENRLNRGFNFKAEGEIQWFQSAADGSKFIKIEKNTYAYVRIAIYFLHYVDKFVTSDLNQAELLAFLLPHYRDKIIFK